MNVGRFNRVFSIQREWFGECWGNGSWECSESQLLYRVFLGACCELGTETSVVDKQTWALPIWNLQPQEEDWH